MVDVLLASVSEGVQDLSGERPGFLFRICRKLDYLAQHHVSLVEYQCEEL